MLCADLLDLSVVVSLSVPPAQSGCNSLVAGLVYTIGSHRWEKQSSAFFQAKAAESLLQGNVVFNLARAGFNCETETELTTPHCDHCED